MAEGLRELIGRAMVDQEFLVDLQREPATVLARFQLTDEERAAVMGALAKLARGSAGGRAASELRNALLRRVST